MRNGDVFTRRIPLGFVPSENRNVDLLVTFEIPECRLRSRVVVEDSTDNCYINIVSQLDYDSSLFTPEQISDIDQLSYEWYDSSCSYATVRQFDLLRARGLLHTDSTSFDQTRALTEENLLYDGDYKFESHGIANDVRRSDLEFFFNLPGDGNTTAEVFAYLDSITHGIRDEEFSALLAGF